MRRSEPDLNFGKTLVPRRFRISGGSGPSGLYDTETGELVPEER
ncbi:MAG: hypothetical protein QME70_04325 [Bacillota bacterium]|nr:hypothetical protein [Bacillota bacterium]